MAQHDGRSMQELLEEAVEALRRKRFLQEVNSAYASLRLESEAWASERRQRRQWERTLLDGLVAEGPLGGPEPRKKRRTRRWG
jgi:hypothetical protein